MNFKGRTVILKGDQTWQIFEDYSAALDRFDKEGAVPWGHIHRNDNRMIKLRSAAALKKGLG